MNFNTCVSAESFDDKFWVKIFDLVHDDLDFEAFKDEVPLPYLLWMYWYYLWKKNGRTEGEFLNPTNLKSHKLQRIWEYTQTIASIYYFSDFNLRDKKIISLGAGIEPCLFTLSKMGGRVIASDIYFNSNYWHPEWTDIIKEKPEIFSHYKTFKPKITFLNLNLKSKRDMSGLGNFDVIYSISTLEHIYSSFRKKKKLFNSIIKHLKKKGIFSFTTELILKYERIKLYNIYLRNLLLKIKYYFNKSFMKSRLNSYSKTDKNNISKKSGSKNRLVANKEPYHLNSIKSFIYMIFNLHRYNRRYDFFTIEEILKIIDNFKKKHIYLVENINWKSCYEYASKSKKFEGQIKASISLTFLKE